jgi:TatD DNase family protein
MEQLLTETDSPYLSPDPGKINRPDNVKHTIQKIAELKQLTVEETSNIIYSNYQRIFL